jgi:ribosomal subunit interface protein
MIFHIPMQMNIQGTNLEVTPAIRAYLERKIPAIERRLGRRATADGALAEIELERTTAHHRAGKIFRAEINITLGGTVFRAEATRDDLTAAIDEMKRIIIRELAADKDLAITRARRGARG